MILLPLLIAPLMVLVSSYQGLYSTLSVDVPVMGHLHERNLPLSSFNVATERMTNLLTSTKNKLKQSLSVACTGCLKEISNSPEDAGQFFLKRVFVASGKFSNGSPTACPDVQFLPSPANSAEIDSLVKLMKEKKIDKQPIAYYLQDDSVCTLLLCF